MRWFLRRKARELDLQRELDAHLQLEAEEREEAGDSAEEAWFAARRAMGNVTSVQESAREAWGWGWLERFFQDVLYGVRSFRRTPTFTAVVVFTLALGIGVNSAVFSIVNAVLLKPLPYKDPNRLVVIEVHPVRNPEAHAYDTYRDFEAWKSRSRSFQQLAAATWVKSGKIFSGRGEAREALAMPVSVNFFRLLGVPPELGRTFQPDDLQRGCAVVLRNRFWANELHGKNNIAGTNIRLDDQSCTVLGVMPLGFTFYPDVVQMWRLIPSDGEIVRDATNSMVVVVGRLAAGASIASADKEIRAIYADVHRHDQHPGALVPVIRPLREEFTFLSGPNLRLSLFMLWGAVTFVLLIACVNVANLLLGRSLAREREFAVRAALGAGRFRLMRQLLTEGLLLSLAGALGGVLLAVAAVHVFRVVKPIQMPPGVTVAINIPVLAYTVGLAILTALLFGLVPAWKASQVDLNGSLKATGRGMLRGFSAKAVGNGLVVLEMALSLVLLTGACLLIKSIVLFASAPLGFSTEHVTSVRIDLPSWRYTKPEQRGVFYREVLRKASRIPGVASAALATSFPLSGGGPVMSFSIEGRSNANEPSTRYQAITPGYLDVMKLALLKGRNFDDRDRRTSEPVVIVNRAFAKQYFPRENAIGQHIKLAEAGSSSPWVTVVGIIADQKDVNFIHEMNWAEEPMIFCSVSQEEPSGGYLFLRNSDDAGWGQGTVRKQIAAIDKDVPVGEPETLQQRFSEVLAYPRFRAILMSVFAGLALLLASVGLYGVLAQLLAQRTQEIGIRMALGAQWSDVLLLVIRQGMALAGIGIVGGLIAAWCLVRFLRALLYQPEASHVWILAGVSFLLFLAALLPTCIPARKAARVDPMVALRYE